MTGIAVEWWAWWVAGFVLLALETAVPGAIFLWMGLSALAVGALAGTFSGLPVTWAASIWAALSVVSVLAYKRFRPVAAATDQPSLNRRGDSYVGRHITLSDPITNGFGKTRLDDTQWRVSGPDAPAGTNVVVVRVDGATLVVEKRP